MPCSWLAVILWGLHLPVLPMRDVTDDPAPAEAASAQPCGCREETTR
jgi:hypothetical protein